MPLVGLMLLWPSWASQVNWYWFRKFTLPLRACVLLLTVYPKHTVMEKAAMFHSLISLCMQATFILWDFYKTLQCVLLNLVHALCLCALTYGCRAPSCLQASLSFSTTALLKHTHCLPSTQKLINKNKYTIYSHFHTWTVQTVNRLWNTNITLWSVCGWLMRAESNNATFATNKILQVYCFVSYSVRHYLKDINVMVQLFTVQSNWPRLNASDISQFCLSLHTG